VVLEIMKHEEKKDGSCQPYEGGMKTFQAETPIKEN
jgi:hypothetical protein